MGTLYSVDGSTGNITTAGAITSTSTTSGFQPPSMTTTQRNAISVPSDGLIVYDTTLHQLWEYQNGAWAEVGGGGGGSPAGTTNDVQYNNAGAFAADSGNFTYTLGTQTLRSVQMATGEIQDLFGHNAISLAAFHLVDVAGMNSVEWEERQLMDTSGNQQLNWANPNLIYIPTGVYTVFGNTAIDPSAALEVDSTIRGLLPPRMTTTQKNAISSPAEGLLVYDTTLHKLSVFTGSVWETVTSS